MHHYVSLLYFLWFIQHHCFNLGPGICAYAHFIPGANLESLIYLTSMLWEGEGNLRTNIQTRRTCKNTWSLNLSSQNQHSTYFPESQPHIKTRKSQTFSPPGAAADFFVLVVPKNLQIGYSGNKKH